jgi:HD-like signal output (HDOD) protein
MSQKTLIEIIDEQFDSDSAELPVFNKVALELQQIKQSETITTEQIAGIILKDQSLASRILRVANSSFFGGLGKVETISRAIVRLGTSQVTSLAMAASLAMAHKSSVPLIANYLQGLWTRSFACSYGARWIAMKTGHSDKAEEAFLAGLLHDLGELFLLKVMDKMARRRDDPLPLSEPLMLEILSVMHTSIGYRLMEKWELPMAYAVIARDHHLGKFDEANEILLMIRLLDLTCLKMGLGCKANPGVTLAATTEAKLLGISEIRLAELEVLLEDKQTDMKAMLG